MINIHITYYQNYDRTWDSHHLGKLLVKDATSLAQAQVFSEVLLKEEYQSIFIAREIINYCQESLK